MYYKGEALKFSLYEILQAKARVTMKRAIRIKFKINPNSLCYNDLQKLFNLK